MCVVCMCVCVLLAAYTNMFVCKYMSASVCTSLVVCVNVCVCVCLCA